VDEDIFERFGLSYVEREYVRTNYMFNDASEADLFAFLQLLLEAGGDARSGLFRMEQHRLPGPDGIIRDEYYCITSLESLRDLAAKTGHFARTGAPRFHDENGCVHSCTVEVFRDDWASSETYTAYLSDVAGFAAQGEPGGYLDRLQRAQLARIAEGEALRHAFLLEFGMLVHHNVEEAHIQRVVNEAIAIEDAEAARARRPAT
jgi:hypothetical protein